MPLYIISRTERTSYTENAKDAADALARALAAGYFDARCIDKNGKELSRAELEAKAKTADPGTAGAKRLPS